MGRSCPTGLCRDEPTVQPVRAFARSVHRGNHHGEAGGDCRRGPDGRLDERPAGPDLRAGNGRCAGHDRYGRHGGDDGRTGGSERDGVVGMTNEMINFYIVLAFLFGLGFSLVWIVLHDPYCESSAWW